MKAKHESQAFARLTAELETPPTKLYSPFNINDSCPKESRSKRNLSKRQQALEEGDVSMSVEETEEETPKRRVALQHKKHLMQANKLDRKSVV